LQAGKRGAERKLQRSQKTNENAGFLSILKECERKGVYKPVICL
jgi:hypothetical protein